MTSALRLSISALALGSSVDASAKCMSSSFSVWPSDGTLPANGQIVLTGYGEAQETIRALAAKKPRLVHAQESIELNVEQLHEGEFRLTQAVLTAERPLQPGKEYRLAIKGVPADDLTVYANDKWGPIRFRAVEEDFAAPAWSEAPELLGTESVAYGCGPSSEGKVKVAVSEPALFLVELERVSTGTSRRFLVEARKGELRIGHSMCSGAFRMIAKELYRARLTAVDAAGRSTPAAGPALELTGPVIDSR